MLGILGLIIILVIIANVTDEVVQITPEEYKKIKEGMTYDEVKDIVGGKAKSEYKPDGYEWTEYEFDGLDGVKDDATVTLFVEDDKVTTKIEDGLLEAKKEDNKTDDTSQEDVAASPNIKDDTTSVNQSSTNNEEAVSDVVTALESNNFVSFANAYKELGSDKTTVWDNDLYGKTVSWTGTVVDVGGTQLFLYGSDDYNSEDWQQLSDNKKLFYAFTAKYANPVQFQNVKPGDKITVQGSLESRGDYDLGFNWKLYNVVLK